MVRKTYGGNVTAAASVPHPAAYQRISASCGRPGPPTRRVSRTTSRCAGAARLARCGDGCHRACGLDITAAAAAAAAAPPCSRPAGRPGLSTAVDTVGVGGGGRRLLGVEWTNPPTRHYFPVRFELMGLSCSGLYAGQ